jgi:hypothetical protein
VKHVVSAILVFMLALSLWPRRDVAPPTGETYAVAVRMRDNYRSMASKSALQHADRVEAGEFKSELEEAKVWAERSKQVMQEVTQEMTTHSAAVYQQARKLPADEGRKARAEFYREMGRGLK